MRYDEKTDLIEISVSELVRISRRHLSPIPPRDEDEPEIFEASRLGLKISGNADVLPEKIHLPFQINEFSFILCARILTKLNTLFVIKETSDDTDRIKKETLDQARGEAFISAYALAIEKGLDSVDINYVFVNSSIGKTKSHNETAKFNALRRFFDKCTLLLSLYAKPEIERVKYRLPTLSRLSFPYDKMREGQREFIESVYKCAARGGTLFAAAPTGTGKTVSALYPALLALGRGKCDKIFYLTPKNTTAIAAAECIELFASRGAKIRAAVLYSKEKLCKKRLICREDRDSCPNRRANNISEATLALYGLNRPVVKKEDILSISEKYSICPHELALSYSELCDAVILDLNYLFDPRVYLRRHFSEAGSYTFLIDEAHNLPERAREMFSAEISGEDITSILKEEILGEYSRLIPVIKETKSAFHSLLYPYLRYEIRTDGEGREIGATHISEPPPELYSIFEKLYTYTEREILEYRGTKGENEKAILKSLYSYKSTVEKFISVLSAYGNGYETFIFFESGEVRVKLFSVDPGERIRERIELGKSAVFFSGTLSPIHYYRSTLGGSGSSEMLEISSPFAPEQLSVSIIDKISTRYSERKDTILAVTRVIAATLSAKRGNYMIFSPSFEYAELLAKSFRAKYPKIKVIVQSKNMNAQEKADFLEEFSKNTDSYLVAFCVMGGIYSEGIDLAGDKLIGAVIVGIGLPSLSYEREAISAYYQDKFEMGKEFAYVYPGINRVLQAAGRVIRREDDRGVIVLIDDRFNDPVYKELMPNLWRGMKFIDSAKLLKDEIDKFWQEN